MLPHMNSANYDKHYSAGLVSSAGGLGVIVPPSIPMVVWGLTCNVSITDMFVAGIGPAVAIGILLIITSWICSKKAGYVGNGEKFSAKKALSAIWEAKWSILMPVIILGGIYSGVFTPTEAAVVAIVYGIIVGVFINKELKLKNLLNLLDANTSFVGGLMITFSVAGALSALFSMLGIPAALTSALLAISSDKLVLLMLMNLFLLVAGMLMDVNSAIIIFGPLLYSVFVTALGMNPIHLSIIVIVNLSIGFVTPPVAPNLFIASNMTGLSITKIARSSVPFLIALFVALMFITYIEPISTLLLS